MSWQALNWAARERIKLYEVSSLDRESLYEPLVYLSSKLNPPPSKSTFPQISIGRHVNQSCDLNVAFVNVDLSFNNF